MDFLGISHGFSIVFLWFPMVVFWMFYGFPMVFLLFSFGFLWISDDFLWISNGFLSVVLSLSVVFNNPVTSLALVRPLVRSGQTNACRTICANKKFFQSHILFWLSFNFTKLRLPHGLLSTRIHTFDLFDILVFCV